MPWKFFWERVDTITISTSDEPFMQEIQIEGITEYLSLDILSIRGGFNEFYRSLQLMYSAFVNSAPTDFFSSLKPWETL